MATERNNDWDPESYASFRGLRLRPALDLLAQVGALPDGDVIDLGCGDGAVGPSLRKRFEGRTLVGVDNSAAMLAAAQGYDALVPADVATWSPKTPPALIFSNACLHWLPDHASLLQRLIGLLPSGGTLAVQMPRQYAAPSHALLRKVAGVDEFTPPVAEPQVYLRLLQGAGEVRVWESDYLQSLPAVDQGHPVRHFTQSTAMRPFVDKLSQSAEDDFLKAYEGALDVAYPKEPDGSVLFAFKRLFFVLRKS